ncbi:hypothetical protein [Bradyrhizobium sp.]|uniref:hypothetical protein n=1 Tax=Bradyrhizobium sp. TaxID=376 RepID=UPI00271F1A9C|nr:hypothetical protein [Bradyrhizobium sp.]MDO9299411.1 hypothetical protein [Bradyrhizobium sp.]
MEPGQAIRAGIAASAIAHLSVLILVLLFSEVHPFGSATADTVAVNIVTPEEVAEKKPEPAMAPEIKPTFDLPAPLPPSSSPAPAPAHASAPAPAPASRAAAQKAPPPPAGQKTAATQPPSAQPPSTPPLPAYAAPQPDLSIKYNVMLGLPPAMSPDLPPARSGDRPGEPFDGPASTSADIASGLVAEFRRHLRTCLKLPPSIAPSDRLKIKLRVFMDLEARLAAEPVLIEASASPKGPALMQAAMAALQACQPYAMLPADRYGEWKVLDLSFTPQDFAG